MSEKKEVPANSQPHNILLLNTTNGSHNIINNSEAFPKYLLYDISGVKDLITTCIMEDGTWEGNLMQKIHSFIKPGGVICDIGANLGSWTVYLSKWVGSSGQVHSFEPQRMIYYQLCGNIFLNQCTNTHAHPYALGTTEQNNQTHYLQPLENIKVNGLDYINIGGGKIMDEKDLEEKQKGELITIRSLDSFHLTPTFLKIDAEGYELNVLKGALETLKRASYPPFVFEAWGRVEFDESKKMLFDFILSLGYNIFHLGNEDYLALHLKDL